MGTKNEIFKEHTAAYVKACKEEKGALLSHVCAVTGMHPKAAIRKFRRLQRRDPAHTEARGRSTYYTPDVTAALKDVWEAASEPCGELLHPVLHEYVDILLRDRMWGHGKEATKKLCAMSERTMKRRVGAFRKMRRWRKGISATRPSHLKRIVPVFTGPWTDKPPGHGQVDTVLHNDSAEGDAVYTVNYTDAATVTVVPHAQWNKGQEATKESLAAMEKQLPFPYGGLHSDSGSEFINYQVKGFCDDRRIEFTRGRPSRSNDNMYVEERNGHVVRKWIGYLPLTCREAVDALNDVYAVLVPYLLHFQAVRRTASKEKVLSKYVRTYEKKSKTPYQRILEHEAVSEEVKERLKREHAKLNPLLLKREIEKRITRLYAVQKRYGTHASSR
ncbi:MAG: hypothetical protein AAB767_00725 [Patescibacteria group bacterium]